MIQVNVKQGFDLAGFHYQVESDDKVDAELRSEQRYGSTSYTEQTVSIASDFGAEQYHDTFCHECVETINVVLCDGKIKHSDVKNISHGLAQIFKSLGVQFVYEDK